ncbi:MAG: hypothetical protein F6J93_23655 [Oscillatoria sp. SIO1A7]|nr:hypothetical protein [Oscillatoria sp. SIO1A7]
MDVSKSQLVLKRNVTIKSVVTPRWKEEVQQQLQVQINQIDAQMQQLEMQAQRMIGEIQKQGSLNPNSDVNSQVENIQGQLNQKQREQLDRKNQILQQLQQVQTLEMETEVSTGQIDSFFSLERGDNLIEKMQVEVLLRDGIVEEIRGDL